jgi:hypothetical protein
MHLLYLLYLLYLLRLLQLINTFLFYNPNSIKINLKIKF